MIIDTKDAFSLIASWDAWKGNGYSHLNYPCVSVSSASHMLGGSVSSIGLTDEEGGKIDSALAVVEKMGEASKQMVDVTVWWVRTKGNASAVEKETGVSRKAVPTMANAGLEICGEFIRMKLGTV